MNSEKIESLIIEKFLECDDVLVTTYGKLDCDSIGSFILLDEFFKLKQKKVIFDFCGKISKKYDWIIDDDFRKKIKNKKQNINKNYSNYDLCIVVDSQISKEDFNKLKSFVKTVIVIDHHEGKERNGDLILNKDEPSTGVIIYNMIKNIIEVNQKIINSTYLTISYDTGGFRNELLKNNTHFVSNELVNMGLNLHDINKTIYSKSLNYFQFLGKCLQNIIFEKDYKICYVVVRKNLIEDYCVPDEEVSSVIETIKWINEAEISILFIEGNNSVRISLRTKTLDANSILSYFGGGGHVRASGCKIENTYIFNVVESVIKYCKTFF